MTTILIRTILIYLLLTAAVRLLGKRQLGELEVSELVTTILLSEIAALPLTDQSIPLIYAVIPLVTIVTLEIALSMLLLKCPRLKVIAASRPNVLIRRGVPDQQEMARIRVSLDELISEIRQAGIPSIAEVDYAILEQNGKISIIPRRSAQPPTAEELGLTPKESGILHVLVEDGHLNPHGLRQAGLTAEEIRKQLKTYGATVESTFLLGIDDGGSYHYINKEGKRRK